MRIVVVVEVFDHAVFDDDLVELAVVPEGGGGDFSALRPEGGLFGATEVFEHGCPGREESGTPLEGAVGVELGYLEFAERELGLPAIETGAGHRDGESHAHGRSKGGAIDRTPLFECAIRPADTALAVDDERDLIVVSGDATVGAQLPQCEGEVADAVGGDREGLTHDGDAPGAARCGQGVLMRTGGVIVDELGDHCKVTCDLLGVLFAEGLQLVARSRMQVARGDLVRQRRLGNTLANRGVLVDRPVDATTGTVAVRRALALIAVVAGAVAVRATLTLVTVTVGTAFTGLATVTVGPSFTGLVPVTVGPAFTGLVPVAVGATLSLVAVTVGATLGRLAAIAKRTSLTGLVPVAVRATLTLVAVTIRAAIGRLAAITIRTTLTGLIAITIRTAFTGLVPVAVGATLTRLIAVTIRTTLTGLAAIAIRATLTGLVPVAERATLSLVPVTVRTTLTGLIAPTGLAAVTVRTAFTGLVPVAIRATFTGLVPVAIRATFTGLVPVAIRATLTGLAAVAVGATLTVAARPSSRGVAIARLAIGARTSVLRVFALATAIPLIIRHSDSLFCCKTQNGHPALGGHFT